VKQTIGGEIDLRWQDSLLSTPTREREKEEAEVSSSQGSDGEDPKQEMHLEGRMPEEEQAGAPPTA